MAAQINGHSFDQNDAKYHTCFGSLHIKLAARIVSIIYIVGAVCNVIYSTARGISLAMYSWLSFACSIGIFGCLVYGVFKEKRVFMLPYFIFQIAGIIVTAFTLIIFIICTAVSRDTIEEIAANYGGVRLDDDPSNVASGLTVQAFTIIFIIFVCILLLLQILFFETIYRFKEFLRDRETSFSFNLDGIFQNPNNVYSTNVDDLDIISNSENTLK
uniref:MARVEL domain-containing protein n=1 Tax=Syphacia muris TaxID=451379 RepID=A0A0N5AE29_9BILA